ncbi:MAG: hypothetical protein MHM6MM_008195 [Cercozoa sp. M6MM]
MCQLNHSKKATAGARFNRTWKLKILRLKWRMWLKSPRSTWAMIRLIRRIRTCCVIISFSSFSRRGSENCFCKCSYMALAQRKVKLVETRSSAHETGLSAEDYLQLQEKLAREEELEKKRKKAFEAEVEFKSSTKATLEKQRKKREQALSDVLSAPAKPPIKPPAKPSTAKRLRSRRKQGRPVAEVQEKRVVEEPHEETKEETPMKERPVNDFDDLLDLSDEEPPKKRRRMVQQDSLSMEMSMEVGIDNADPCESLPQSMEIVLDAPAKVLAANKVAPRTGDSESEDVDILDLL